jgi:hypothetical protein
MAKVSRDVEAGWVACQNDKDNEVVEQFKKKGVTTYRITDAELQKAKQITKITNTRIYSSFQKRSRA